MGGFNDVMWVTSVAMWSLCRSWDRHRLGSLASQRGRSSRSGTSAEPDAADAEELKSQPSHRGERDFAARRVPCAVTADSITQ